MFGVGVAKPSNICRCDIRYDIWCGQINYNWLISKQLNVFFEKNIKIKPVKFMTPTRRQLNFDQYGQWTRARLVSCREWISNVITFRRFRIMQWRALKRTSRKRRSSWRASNRLTARQVLPLQMLIRCRSQSESYPNQAARIGRFCRIFVFTASLYENATNHLSDVLWWNCFAFIDVLLDNCVLSQSCNHWQVVYYAFNSSS